MSEYAFDHSELATQVGRLTNLLQLLAGKVELTSRVAEQLFRNQHNPHNWNAYTIEREKKGVKLVFPHGKE